MTHPKVIYKEEFLHLIQLHKNNTLVTKSRLESLLPPMDKLIQLVGEELKITLEYGFKSLVICSDFSINDG